MFRTPSLTQIAALMAPAIILIMVQPAGAQTSTACKRIADFTYNFVDGGAMAFIALGLGPSRLRQGETVEWTMLDGVTEFAPITFGFVDKIERPPVFIGPTAELTPAQRSAILVAPRDNVKPAVFTPRPLAYGQGPDFHIKCRSAPRPDRIAHGQPEGRA